jgi:xanthine dehydrogenase YagS FAD-binding subunit
MATVGGNLLQRTRCAYFQDVSKPCNKRQPGSGCPARTGWNHDSAILGTSLHCVATYPGDMAVALSALDAVVHVETPTGPQVIPLNDFYRLPEEEPQRDTNLAPSSLIVAVEVPPPPEGFRSAYRKARDRASFAFALASVAAGLVVADGVITEARISFGSLAHMPWRARRAEAILIGSPATTERFRQATTEELAAAQPLEHNAYKAPLAARLTMATLSQLAGVDP